MLSQRLAEAILPELEFTSVRASGPGGQNVNKVNSKVELRWKLEESKVLSPEVKARLLEKFPNRFTKLGELYLSSGRFRDKLRNQEDCLERLHEMVESILLPPKKRKKTKPSKGAKEKRITTKKLHSSKKTQRRFSSRTAID